MQRFDAFVINIYWFLTSPLELAAVTALLVKILSPAAALAGVLVATVVAAIQVKRVTTRRGISGQTDDAASPPPLGGCPLLVWGFACLDSF